MRYPIGSKVLAPNDEGYGIIDEYRGTNEYHITFDDGSGGWYNETHYNVIGKSYKVIPPKTLDEELFIL